MPDQHRLRSASEFLEMLSAKRTASTGQEKQEMVQQLAEETGLLPYPVPMILITGTCGKGSTSMFLSSILEAHGYQVGSIQSPHLRSFSERIQVNRIPVSEEEILMKTVAWLPLFERLAANDKGYRALNYNLVFLLVGMHLFKECKMDFALIETGIGGYNDPSTFFDPILSIITNVHRDHEAVLGGSLEAIAYDKSGAIKARKPVVTGTTIPSALRVLEQEAERKGAPIFALSRDFHIVNQDDHSTYQEDGYTLPFQLGVTGAFQQENAALAIKASLLLQEMGYRISDRDIQEGVKRTKIPARFQVMSQTPLVVIDGAHNEEEMQRFCETVKALDRKTHYMILSFSSDKNILQMMYSFRELHCCYLLAPHSNRSRLECPTELQHLLHSHGYPCLAFGTLEQAFDYAMAHAQPQDGIFFTGSMFLAGDALELWDRRS